MRRSYILLGVLLSAQRSVQQRGEAPSAATVSWAPSLEAPLKSRYLPESMRRTTRARAPVQKAACSIRSQVCALNFQRVHPNNVGPIFSLRNATNDVAVVSTRLPRTMPPASPAIHSGTSAHSAHQLTLDPVEAKRPATTPVYSGMWNLVYSNRRLRPSSCVERWCGTGPASRSSRSLEGMSASACD